MRGKAWEYIPLRRQRKPRKPRTWRTKPSQGRKKGTAKVTHGRGRWRRTARARKRKREIRSKIKKQMPGCSTVSRQKDTNSGGKRGRSEKLKHARKGLKWREGGQDLKKKTTMKEEKRDG